MRRISALVVAVLGLTAAGAQAETCPQQVHREISELRKEQMTLRRGPHESGPIQELRQCTRQALRMGLTLAVRGPASEKDAAKEELANCLELRIKSISNMCYCRQLGTDVGRELDMPGLASQMEEIGGAYARVTDAAERARQRAIQNPLIMDYVDTANKYKECYDRLTLAVLEGLTRKLDAIAIPPSAPPSPDAGLVQSVPSPTVPSHPSPSVPLPTARSPAPAVAAPTVPSRPQQEPPATATMREILGPPQKNPQSDISGLGKDGSPGDVSSRGVATPSVPSPTIHSPTPSVPSPTVRGATPSVPSPTIHTPTPSIPSPTVNNIAPSVPGQKEGGISLDVRSQGHAEELNRSDVLKLLPPKPGN